MNWIWRLVDSRNHIEGKIVAVITAFVLAFTLFGSYGPVSAFAGDSGASDETLEVSDKPIVEENLTQKDASGTGAASGSLEKSATDENAAGDTGTVTSNKARTSAAPTSVDSRASGNSSTSGYSYTFTPTINNADVKYVYFNDASGAAWSNAKSVSTNSTSFTIDSFSSSGKTGYIVFFVKPADGYLLTGLGADGNGDIYPTSASSFGNIKSYPEMSSLAQAAYKAGYIACFGYSRTNTSGNGTAEFNVSGVKPAIEVAAICNKTDNVVPGDNLTFTVTVTPETTVNGKKLTVKSGSVTKLTINDQKVTADLKWDDDKKAYVGEVPYVATAADCESGKITLSAEAEVDYSYALGTSTTAVTTNVTIKNSGSTTCTIAAKDGITYAFNYAAESGEVPANKPQNIQTAPVDNTDYYSGSSIQVDQGYTSSSVIYDSDNGGYWTFSGWGYPSGGSVGETIKATGKPIILSGTWTFHKVTLTAEGYNGTYDGKSHGLKNTGEVSDAPTDAKVVLLYATSDSKDGNFTSVESAPTRTNAGTTYVKVSATINGSLTISKVVALTIAQRPVAIAASDASKTYGEADPAFTAEVTGLVEGESLDLISYELERDAGENVGKYTIAASGDEDQGNYKVSYQSATFTITAQSINSDDTDTYKAIAVNSPEDVVYNGLVQQQPITVASAEGDDLLAESDYSIEYTDATNVGTVTVTITGKGNYTGTVTREYNIMPATLAVTTPNTSKTYDGTALTADGTLTGLVNGETATFTTTGTQTEVGSSNNTYIITWDGTASEKNYTVVENLGTLTVDAAPVVPTPAAPTPTPTTPTTTPVAPATTPVTPAAVAAAIPAVVGAAVAAAPAAVAAAAGAGAPAATPLAAADETTIEDDENPMANYEADLDCWVHWLMIAGIIVSAIYGAVVVGRRTRFAGKVESFENSLTGTN